MINNLNKLLNFNDIKISKSLINNLDNIFIDFKKSQINNLKIINEEKLDNIENNHFVTNKVKSKINKLNNLKKISYNFKNTDILLNLYFNKISKKKINELINIINFSITTFDKLNNHRNNIKLDIYYCNFNKFIKINNKDQLIPDNINSGFTTFFADKDDDYIVIYRQEEINKVIIHELIHLYRFHNFKIQNPKINELIKTKIKLDISETYTETFATILYTYYYSKLNNQDFNKLLNEQFNFSLLQSAKILYNQNINKLEYPININETTNAISYFILRSAILNNFKLYENIFNKNIYLNEKNKILLFNENLIKSIKNKNFINYINQYLLILKNNNIDKNLLNTFRMNILD
jgi:hypothetical protein